LEKENQDLEKNYQKKDEDNSCLKNLNQRLLEQIRKLKDEKLESQDIKKKVDKSKKEELARLKNHNQNLLTQIKNLKNDKKSLENKLEQFIEKEASKSSGVKIQVVEKGTNTDPIHITTQEDANPIEEKTYRDVGVQTMEISGVLINKNSAINNATSIHGENKTLKVNQENATSTIRESHATKTPY
jgi:predicted RNase H-like nuclease (RuvC/YqgF family)